MVGRLPEVLTPKVVADETYARKFTNVHKPIPIVGIDDSQLYPDSK